MQKNSDSTRGERHTRMYSSLLPAIIDEAKKLIEEGKISTGFTVVKPKSSTPSSCLYPELWFFTSDIMNCPTCHGGMRKRTLCSNVTCSFCQNKNNDNQYKKTIKHCMCKELRS